MSTTKDLRVQSEREFHNERFSEESREAQWKYYTALRTLELDYERVVRAHSRGSKVLDYGCSLGRWTRKISEVASQIDGIDISDVAIGKAREASAGLANVAFHVMDAHSTSFADDSFDVIFGSGIVHHLETRKCLTEVARILKPGGVAIFKEPLGHNPVFNTYRASTPQVRTQDEHPLRKADWRIGGELFAVNEWNFYGLATLASVPLRNTVLGKPALAALEMVDSLLLRMPGLRWQAWMALIVMRK